ncbi:PK beta-barrel-protein domain-containing protein-like protein [Mollisia scopiformis]|uniref:PK beta-barrel-protein domain-containing protein-like protein n=1 Tax=Mollisia scopiformis TaxID=149040 RepID=A0A194XRB6_MOLSC|nr:PK beta-barrel-protein domain-containing protein-like protein [Mollisia scopiformis]KUJ22733.1 PK beta-barrel-protein domain-containing protein-like protein [Mollisia scopiformis]
MPDPLIYAVPAVVFLYASIYYIIPFVKRILFSHRSGVVLSVSKSPTHSFSKPTFDSITLIAGLGVEGDSHLGVEVQHLSRRKGKIIPPNLRQVHIMQSELFDEVKTVGSNGKSYDIKPGDLGENITTRGLDVLNLSVGTRLKFVNEGEDDNGKCAIVRVTGLRNPCPQIDNFRMDYWQGVL